MIRPAVPEDAPLLRDFLAALHAERCPYLLSRPSEPTLEEAVDLVRDYAETPRSALLVAPAAGAIVGLAQFSPYGHPQQRHAGHLAVSVRADWRRKGVGRALLEALLDWARGVEGLRRLSLEVLATNAPAVRLYERLGFAVDGAKREAVRDGDAFIDILLMSRRV